jgi:hypothetical protein
LSLFENEDHRSMEKKALAWCEKSFRCKAHGYNDETSPLDFYLTRGNEVIAFGDVKSRTCKFGEYPTLRMSTRKVANMLLHATLHEKPVLLVVPFGCGETRWVDVRNLTVPMDVSLWVRKVYRADNDAEPAFEIELSDLKESP